MDKPFFNIPQCDDCLLLVNKRALFLIQQGGKITFPFDIHPSNVNSLKFQRWLLATGYSRLDGTKDFARLDDSFVELDGQFEYIYRAVPCGKCDVCTWKKKVSFINRAKAESECYITPPFFFTLTYNDEHVPADYNLCYRDVQLFFKRFRKLCQKKGLPTDFRYVVAGEYGSKGINHRPHYHVILWNNPHKASYFNYHLWDVLCRDLWLCWQKDDWYVFSRKENFGVCGDGVAGYVAKYIGKPVSYGRRVKPFVHMSVGHGGIGSPFFKQFKDAYSRSSDTNFRYVSHIDGQIKEFTFGSYLKQYFHPSPSRLVPAKVKFLYKDLSERFERYVRLGMPWQDAYDFLESVRPCKNVVAHRLPPIDDIARDSSFLRWLMNKEVCQVDAFFELLSNLCEVPDSSIMDYYRLTFLSSSKTEDVRGSLASKKSKLRQKQKLTESKTLL